MNVCFACIFISIMPFLFKWLYVWVITAAAASSSSTNLLDYVYTIDLLCQGLPVFDLQFQTGLFSLRHKIG